MTASMRLFKSCLVHGAGVSADRAEQFRIRVVLDLLRHFAFFTSLSLVIDLIVEDVFVLFRPAKTLRNGCDI